MIVSARLVKRKTDDGLMEMSEGAPLGKEYLVDLSTRAMKKGYNYIHDKSWQREMIRDVAGGWLPTELLEVDEDEQVAHDHD